MLGKKMKDTKKRRAQAEVIKNTANAWLQQNFAGWNVRDLFKGSFLNNSNPTHVQQMQFVTYLQEGNLAKVTPDFYVNGKKHYRDKELVYDFTALQSKGINVVYDLTIDTAIYACRKEKFAPMVVAHTRIVDLIAKKIIRDRIAYRLGDMKVCKTLTDLGANNGTLLKQEMESLTQKVAKELANISTDFNKKKYDGNKTPIKI
jgi:hypothetical protein